MKKLWYLAGTIICLLVIVIACEDENVKSDMDPQQEKIELIKSLGDKQLKATGPLVYSGELCPGDDFTAHTPKGAFNDQTKWTFYKFHGVQGELAHINVVRVDCEMDPSFTLYFGTSNVIDGINYMTGNVDLEYVTFRDDQVPRPAGCADYCFSWGDPGPEVLLPYTGWYTLAVYDFASCGATDPLEFHLTITGIGCTIKIDGCDTGVLNEPIGDFTMQQLIDDCALNPKNHGQYVRCVAKLVEGWFDDGLISLEEKDAIMECAAESGIPY